MADESDEQPRRLISLALAALAVVGWLAAGFIGWQGAQTRSQLTAQLAAAEKARESLATDLQNLEKAAGAAAELKKRATAAEKALSDASAARASAQNELADLTRQIGDAKLAISGAQEETSAKTRDLQAVDARLKDETDRMAALQSQEQALSAEQGRLHGETDAARTNSPKFSLRQKPREESSRRCKARSPLRPPSSTPFRRKSAPRIHPRGRPGERAQTRDRPPARAWAASGRLISRDFMPKRGICLSARGGDCAAWAPVF